MTNDKSLDYKHTGVSTKFLHHTYHFYIKDMSVQLQPRMFFRSKVGKHTIDILKPHFTKH